MEDEDHSNSICITRARVKKTEVSKRKSNTVPDFWAGGGDGGGDDQ